MYALRFEFLSERFFCGQKGKPQTPNVPNRHQGENEPSQSCPPSQGVEKQKGTAVTVEGPWLDGGFGGFGAKSLGPRDFSFRFGLVRCKKRWGFQFQTLSRTWAYFQGSLDFPYI